MFATIGTFYDPSGDAQLCFTKRHQTPIVSSSFPQTLGLKTPGHDGDTRHLARATSERDHVVARIAENARRQEGRHTRPSCEPQRVTKVVAPALQQMGVERGTDGTVTISGSDTTAALAELDSFIERWKSDGTNALILVGENVASKQFVEKIKQAIPDMLLIADTTSILDGGREEVKAHANPNPYDGAMSAEGQTGLEHTKTEHFKYCAGIWTKATGQPAPSPNVVVKLPNGKQNDVYGGMEDALSVHELLHHDRQEGRALPECGELGADRRQLRADRRHVDDLRLDPHGQVRRRRHLRARCLRSDHPPNG